jgi:purine-nucleoside/S-methyl-5'-thioadenosine phosphorylase / adenosine deaminase
MIEHDIAGTRYFTYDVFDPYVNVTNAVTTRHRGQSKPPFHTLNLGFRSGDDPDAVLENRAVVAQILGFEPEALTLARQVHGSAVAVVRARDRGRGAVVEDDAFPKTDAMITNEADVPLGVLIADCAAVSFYDPGKSAIGIAHAGWKGTLARIVEKTIGAMAAAYGSEPPDIVAGVSPCVGACHYEVGAEVAEAYRGVFGEEAAYFLTKDPRGSYRLHLTEANRRQLLQAGIAADKIETSGLCTACTRELFYSYRRDGARTGRFAGIIVLHRTGHRLY